MTSYPKTRLRRLKSSKWIQEMLEETKLNVSDLVLPLFVHDEKNETPIASLPNISRLPINKVIEAAKFAASLGIPAIALFPATAASLKTADGKEALNPDNLICKTISEVKGAVPEIGIIADVALDPYTKHGHDGVLDSNNNVANDATVEILAQQALLLARSGADIVAPSDMMDGRVQAIRNILEANKFHNTAILAYSAKYASALYGPFRDAVGSTQTSYIDKRGYQLNPANITEAIRKVEQDILEGADMVMVKPAMPYLDIIAKIKSEFRIPVFAYQVSGEYAMIKTMPNANVFMLEALTSIKRSGANAIFTYDALNIAKQL